MFSTDRNIETIGQLVEALKHYIGLQSKYVKLDVMEKCVRLLSALALAFVLSLLLLICLIYASFAVAFALKTVVGEFGAFAIVAGFYFLLFVLCFIFRKKWIERPLVRFLAQILTQ